MEDRDWENQLPLDSSLQVPFFWFFNREFRTVSQVTWHTRDPAWWMCKNGQRFLRWATSLRKFLEGGRGRMASGSGILRALGPACPVPWLNGGYRKVRKLGRKAPGFPPSTLCSTLEVTTQGALPVTYLGISFPIRIKPPDSSASSKRLKRPHRCPLPLPHFRPLSTCPLQTL